MMNDRTVTLEAALRWIRDIADKEFAGDDKLRHRGARTLKRIADKCDEALGEKGES